MNKLFKLALSLFCGLATLPMETTGVAQGTSPFTVTCPPEPTNWLCGVGSTTPVTYPPPTTSGGTCLFRPTVTCSPPSGGLFILGITTVTCTATNRCGESDSCTFRVTVMRDTVPPVIRCPASITNLLCGDTPDIPVTYETPNAADNSGGNVTVVCVPPSGSLFLVGRTPITCTATDDCTNRSTCSFSVTVRADTAPPVIHCPTNMVLWTCSTGAVTHYGVTATDDVDLNVTLFCAPPAGSQLPVGRTTVKCEAMDQCGKSSTCSFEVQVIRDTAPPTITCPSNLVFNCLCPGSSFSLDFFKPEVIDNHDPSPVIVCDPPSLISSPGVHPVICTATDNCGNSNQCSFTVTFNYDTTPPVIHCPTDIIVPTGSATAIVNYPISATDGCSSNVSIVCTPPSGSTFPLGVTGVMCVAMDGCSNRSTCTFSVAVRLAVNFDGSIHQPLGLARLNINTNHQLEVEGLGANGEDGVNIDLGESDGLRWRMLPPPHPTNDEMTVNVFGKTTSGTEVIASSMTFSHEESVYRVKPKFPTYELKLLLHGDVVYREGGRTGFLEIPPCQQVEHEHCVGQPFTGFNPHVPYCVSFLTVECEWETAIGPIRADMFVVTPEGPAPELAALTRVEIRGQGLPGMTLYSERLLKFGKAEQPSIPHRALGDVEYVSRSGMLTVENRTRSEIAGVGIDFGDATDPALEHSPEPDGGYMFEDLPPWLWNPGSDYQVVAYTTPSSACPSSILGSLKLSADNGDDLIVDITCRPCESWLPPRFIVFNEGVPVGERILSASVPLATIKRLGAGLPQPVRTAKLPSHSLGFQIVFNDVASFHLSDGTTLIGNEIRVLAESATGTMAPFRSLDITANGAPWIKILDEGMLARFRVACPSDITTRACSTNHTAVTFSTPMATGGACTQPAAVYCVPPSGSLFPTGTSTISCIATNACGDRASCSFNLTVLDETSPLKFDCPTNQSVLAISSSGRKVRFDSLFDSNEPGVVITCTPPSGSTFPIGTTPVVCTARDICGREQVCTFTVEVHKLELRATPSPSGMTLAWPPGAKLWTADALSGPWFLVPGVISPLVVQPHDRQQFFQLTAESADPVETCGDVRTGPAIWDINVPTARIRGAFLLNGMPFPISFLHGGNFFLRNAAGDEVYLGLSNNQYYERQVVQGRYDVIYQHKTGTYVPLNSRAVVFAGIEIAGDTDFDIDVPATTVEGDFTLNGNPFPASQLEHGRISARDPLTGTLTTLGDTMEQHYSAMLVSGEYDILYSAVAGQNIAPFNTLTPVVHGVQINASGPLDIDVPTITLSGNFLINGLATPNSQTEQGTVYLVDQDTGAKSVVGHTRFQSYQRVVIPGTYDFVYEAGAGQDVMPANTEAIFLAGVPLYSDGSYNINLSAVDISGDILVNGSPAPESNAENAELWLENGTDSVFLGHSKFGHFARRVIPGSYTVTMRRKTGQAVIPLNNRAILGTAVVTSSTDIDLNIPTVEFTADFHFNGVPFPYSKVNESAHFYLEDTETSDLIRLPLNYPAAETVSCLLVPGSYRIRYQYQAGTNLPRNQMGLIGTEFVVGANLQTVVDIRAISLSGALLVNGSPFPPTIGGNASILLKAREGGDSVFLGGIADSDYSTTILPGRYDAIYDWSFGSLIPRNQQATLECQR